MRALIPLPTTGTPINVSMGHAAWRVWNGIGEVLGVVLGEGQCQGSLLVSKVHG